MHMMILMKSVLQECCDGSPVARRINIVLDGVGSYCSAENGFPLDEQDGV